MSDNHPKHCACGRCRGGLRTGPSGLRCATLNTEGGGERCIKELMRMADGDLIHGGGHTWLRGDRTEGLGEHLSHPSYNGEPSETTMDELGNVEAFPVGATRRGRDRDCPTCAGFWENGQFVHLRDGCGPVKVGASIVAFPAHRAAPKAPSGPVVTLLPVNLLNGDPPGLVGIALSPGLSDDDATALTRALLS